MSKEHIRRHVADSRGRFTLLLLPPFFGNRTPSFRCRASNSYPILPPLLQKAPLQTWNPLHLHLAKENSLNDQKKPPPEQDQQAPPSNSCYQNPRSLYPFTSREKHLPNTSPLGPCFQNLSSPLHFIQELVPGRRFS